MKDYFDLHYLSETQTFTGSDLTGAIKASFARRKTPLPAETPAGLLQAFAEDAGKQTQWRAFARRLQIQESIRSLGEVIACLNRFLMPPVEALVRDDIFRMSWTPPGPWRRQRVPTSR
jgi:hypothetical protein